MPKIKTCKGAAKRFSTTGTGKIKRKKAFLSHILTKKNSKRKRALRQATQLDKVNIKGVKRLIPYA